MVSQHNAVLAAHGLRGRVSTTIQRFVSRHAALVTGASTDLVDEARRHGARQPRLAPVPSPRVPGLLADEPLGDVERRTLAADLLRENGIESASDAALVLTIARIAPQKDLETLVDAAAQASVQWAENPAGRAVGPAVWVVVGDGDDDLLHRLRRRALVVQEALAAGVPVVATDTGGLRDLVEGVGALVPVGDAKAMASGVDRYLADPAARHTASAAGRERATSWDDGKATASRWHQWYSALPGMT